MKNLEGQRAAAFSLPGNDGKNHSSGRVQDYNCCAVLLSEGQYAGLNQGGLRVPRAEFPIQKGQFDHPRRQQGQHRIAQEVCGKIQAALHLAL